MPDIQEETSHDIQLVTAYRFDADGYYMGTDPAMEGMLPPDDTMLQPEERGGYWPRFVDGAWTYERMPESAEDFAEMGIVVDHQSHTPRTEELRRRIRAVAPIERVPGGLALQQESGTNNLSVVHVPELTEAEKALEEDEAADNALAERLADLRERMAYAQLLGDDELIDELRAEYRELMGV